METAAAAPSAAPSSPSPSPAPSTPAPAAPTPASAAPASTPAPTGAPSPGTPPAPEPKRYKFKADGIEEEIEGDLLDKLAAKMRLSPEEILKGAQMNRSAYQRWQEAAKLRKEAEEREKAWKSRYEDPRIAQVKAKDPGLSDDEAWALVKTQELYERSQMNPDQRALMEERQRRESLEKAAKEREEGEKKARVEAETKAEAAKLDRSLVEAMAKHALPKSPAWGRAILDHLATMARAGEVPDVEAAALHVKRQVQGDDRSRLTAMSDDQIESWLGKPIIDRILAHSVAKVRGGAAPTPTPPPPPVTPSEPAERKMLTEEEWRAKYR